MRPPASLITAVLVHLAVGPLVSQEPAALVADARVRLMMVGVDRWTLGNLLMPPRDSLRLVAGDSGDALAIATASLARFEVSKGRHRQTGRGGSALIGGVLFGLLGAGIGAITGSQITAE